MGWRALWWEAVSSSHTPIKLAKQRGGPAAPHQPWPIFPQLQEGLSQSHPVKMLPHSQKQCEIIMFSVCSLFLAWFVTWISRPEKPCQIKILQQSVAAAADLGFGPLTRCRWCQWAYTWSTRSQGSGFSSHPASSDLQLHKPVWHLQPPRHSTLRRRVSAARRPGQDRIPEDRPGPQRTGQDRLTQGRWPARRPSLPGKVARWFCKPYASWWVLVALISVYSVASGKFWFRLIQSLLSGLRKVLVSFNFDFSVNSRRFWFC